MENTQASGETWPEQKAKLKAQFSDLTDDDLHFEAGKSDEMFNNVAAKLGKTKEEWAYIIEGLTRAQ